MTVVSADETHHSCYHFAPVSDIFVGQRWKMLLHKRDLQNDGDNSSRTQHETRKLLNRQFIHNRWLLDWLRLSKVLCLHQHNIGYTADGFLQVWWPNQQCQSTEGGWL